MSGFLFNEHTGLCIVCPVTNALRDFPFHVPIPSPGVVMVEQAKSVDYRARDVGRIRAAPEAVLGRVLAILKACIY